jgi:hypothetical protein
MDRTLVLLARRPGKLGEVNVLTTGYRVGHPYTLHVSIRLTLYFFSAGTHS